MKERYSLWLDNSIFIGLVLLILLLSIGTFSVQLPDFMISIGADTKFLVLILITMWCVSLTINKMHIQYLRRLNPNVYMFFAVLFLASLFSFKRWDNILYFLHLSSGFLFSLIMLTHLRSRKKIRILLLFLFFSLSLMFLSGLLQFYSGTPLVPEHSKEFTSPFGNVAESSLFFVSVLPLMFLFLRNQSPVKRIGLGIFLWMMTLCASFSLHPMILGFSLTFCFAYMFYKLYQKRDFLVVLCLLLFCLGCLTLFYPAIFHGERPGIAALYQMKQDAWDPFWSDLQVVQNVWHDYPFSGLGAGQLSSQYLLSLYHNAGERAEFRPRNFYIFLIVSYGFCGVVSLFFLIRFLLSASITKSSSFEMIIIQASLIAFFVGIFFLNPWENYKTFVLMWLVLGIWIRFHFGSDINKMENS